MGQKVNPIDFRIPMNYNWESNWYAGSDYSKLLIEDLQIRRYLSKQLEHAGVSRIIIERSARKVVVTVKAARPGVIIGKKGSDIEKLRMALNSMVNREVSFNIVDIFKPEADARLIADNIARQLQRRVSFRRAMKRAVQTALRLGVKGIRINIKGRLGGAEIARMEWHKEGQIPLHTLRADIDYGTATAETTYGCCGIKVWVHNGEISRKKEQVSEASSEESLGDNVD